MLLESELFKTKKLQFKLKTKASVSKKFFLKENSKKMGANHRIVLSAIKKEMHSNSSSGVCPRSLYSKGNEAIITKIRIQKATVNVINRSMSEWSARRALRAINVVSDDKRK